MTDCPQRGETSDGHHSQEITDDLFLKSVLRHEITRGDLDRRATPYRDLLRFGSASRPSQPASRYLPMSPAPTKAVSRSGCPANMPASSQRRQRPDGRGRRLLPHQCNASGAAAASREFQVGGFSPTVNINLNFNLSGQADLVFLAPSYTFAQPVFGGQLAVTLASVYGRNSASIAGTLTGPLGKHVQGFRQDALVSAGDLYPTVSLKWNKGVNNFMVYASGDIPVGDYNPIGSANLGIGHGAIDAGAGYTYFNPATGNELSGIGGFTYNFLNPDTNTRAASTSISTGACRTSCRSRCSSASSATPISRSPTISVSRRFSAASARASSASVRRSATFSRSPTSRPS